MRARSGAQSAKNASKRPASSTSSRCTERDSRATGSSTTRPFSTRQVPATNPSTRNVGATAPFMRMTFFRYCSGSTRVRSAKREQHVVPLRQEANGRRSLGIWQRRARDVEELAAVLVAKAAQRLEPLERTVELRHVHHARGADVASRHGAERREVTTEDL